MTIQELTLIAALVLAMAAMLVAWQLRAHMQREKSRADALQNDLRALCSAAVNVGERMNQMERRLRQVASRQEELGLRDTRAEDGDQRSFDQAVKLLQKGAGIDEIIDICGLSRGEAELVAMMQRLEK